MNKQRYTTNTTGAVVAPIQSEIKNLFSKNPPFNIKSGLTHSVLSKNFTVEKGDLQYMFIKRMEEIKGSPFKLMVKLI
jgi:hypothetical protein